MLLRAVSVSSYSTSLSKIPLSRGVLEKKAIADTRLCVTTERDSGKDEAVVFIFIVATVGLLGWALVRPWVKRWMEVRLCSYLSPGSASCCVGRAGGVERRELG